MQLLDGKKAGQAIREEIRLHVAQRLSEGKKQPHLTAILIGNNGASATYVGAKVKACEEAGILSTLLHYENDLPEQTLLEKIESLNNDPDVDGILVQLPLPKQIRESAVIHAIDPKKDVDGFHPINQGLLMQGQPGFIPATPYGIQLLLQHYKIETAGKEAVVIGRSNIVGRPMSVLLSQPGPVGNCTVTLCHSKTTDLAAHIRRADIVVAALGQPEFVNADMIKPGAVVIDVGITRVENPSKKSGFELKGDVDFATVSRLCSWITPVPGGVGPMTIAALLQNTLLACQQKDI
ncbi:MAG: bifunctional 5,10-methylenetetrahydrofolate dehydrogenase/5,10-methenyltetrahydrofolate cyclohydrolase [Bacteroidetes bacterium]|nr:bifunctional 5,10-methylenetetrahydrofolate dehydrogenase/5,10-methenyltetrahydrofolate cyclohydrolase [Bacteroidota bacterium]